MPCSWQQFSIMLKGVTQLRHPSNCKSSSDRKRLSTESLPFYSSSRHPLLVPSWQTLKYGSWYGVFHHEWFDNDVESSHQTTSVARRGKIFVYGILSETYVSHGRS
eukprot:scaffold742_cov165-Amphora_coffeaeformis.AAC.2